MENEINFKELWMKQPVTQPDVKELSEKLKRLKYSGYMKLIITNLLLIGTSVAIVLLWLFYKPAMISTSIGMSLVILAMLIFVLSYNRLLPVLKKIDATQSNTVYLQNLLELKEKQTHLQQTMLSIYFVMISLGVCLYMVEPLQQVSLAWAVTTYILTFVWIGFNWFYIRPKTIKKQQADIDELIAKLEAMNDQLHQG